MLLAYGKIDLFADIIESAASDDPALVATLEGLFSPRDSRPFRDEMAKHPLRREIIATVVGNTIVNLCGPTFPGRLREAAGCDTRALVVGIRGRPKDPRFRRKSGDRSSDWTAESPDRSLRPPCSTRLVLRFARFDLLAWLKSFDA